METIAVWNYQKVDTNDSGYAELEYEQGHEEGSMKLLWLYGFILASCEDLLFGPNLDSWK